MRYVVINGNAVIGVAHFVDDAQRCAERMSGIPFTTWTPAGELLQIDGTQTGYKLAMMEA